MINSQLGLGKRLQNKIRMIGTILKKEFTMTMSSRRKYTKQRKPKICNLKLDIN
jgi:hypothetical protein